MSQRRTKIVDRDLNRLAYANGQIVRLHRNPEPASQFKTPEYNDVGNPEYFISRFRKITAANRWAGEASTLHLREVLKGELGRERSPAEELSG